MVTSASDLLLEYQSVYPSKIDLNKITAIRSRNFAPASHAAAKAPYTARAPGDDALIKSMLEESERFIASSSSQTPFVYVTESKKDEELGSFAEAPREKNEIKEKKQTFVIPDSVSDDQRAILELLDSEGEMNADRLSVRTGMPIADVLSELTMLEIEGHVCALPGGNYKINI